MTQPTAEEMIQGAIRLGMDSLGFSGHAPLGFPNNWAMKNTEAYYAELLQQKKRYEGQLSVYLGLEQDYYSPPPPQWCEYLIGSVHLIRVGEQYYPTDYTSQALMDAANGEFGGDIYSVVETYYALVGQLPERTGCQIIGHFDVITKNNERHPLFDPNHPRYVKAAMDALDALAEHDLVFEINTGAMSRGYRTTPYPDKFLLRAMGERNLPICLSSDAHDARHLLHGFREASQWAKSCGYNSCVYWNGKEFCEDALPD
ncbi:MAG: histidinol-phosphatase HisJ family protein [Ruminococcaceae bacterium]|nr:histidinol-phosphatase HisJ family protein [Oscillospiraceae bacterium]